LPTFLLKQNSYEEGAYKIEVI